MQNFRALGALPSDPQTASPPLRISGYAPGIIPRLFVQKKPGLSTIKNCRKVETVYFTTSSYYYYLHHSNFQQ